MIFRSYSRVQVSTPRAEQRFAFRRVLPAVCGSVLFLAAGCAEVPLSAEATGDVNQAVSESADAKGADGASDKAGECDHARGEGRHAFHGHRRHDLVHAALQDLELTSEQRAAIEKLEADSKPKFDGDSPHAAYRAALAAQVKSGNIDATALREQASALSAEGDAWKAKRGATLTSLHQLLTAEQRATLVDARLREPSPAEGHDAPDAKGDAPERRGHHGHGKGHGHFGPERMLFGLELTDTQRATLEALRETQGAAARPEERDPKERQAQFQQMQERMNAFLTTFKSDHFDATAMPEPPHADRREKMFERELDVLRTIVPDLTIEQRTTLAERLERGPQGRHGHHGGDDAAPQPE